MPDTKDVIWTVVGLAVLLTILGMIHLLLANPPILVGLVAVIGGIVYFLARRKRARNRV